MAASFFHGAESARIQIGPDVIKTAKSAVVALVGTAPIQNVDAEDRTINEVVLITSQADAVKYFGEHIEGYTIPDALGAIFESGGSVCYVINVFDPATHVDDGSPSPTEVTAADILGAVSSEGIRTGVELVQTCLNLYGAGAKQILVPVYGSLATVWARLVTLTESLMAQAFIDIPAGTSVSDAIASRGSEGSLNFNLSSQRMIICYPHIKIGDRLAPLSPRAVAATVKMHLDTSRGYWHSISSQTVDGATGIEIDFVDDSNPVLADVQMLNAVGILTVRTGFGSGIQFFGTRNASFPTQSGPESFVHHVTAIDVFDESAKYYLNQKSLDKPGSPSWRERNIKSINKFGAKMVFKGALTAAICEFRKAKNSTTQNADGHFTFTTRTMSTPIAERITHEIEIDISLLATG